MSPGNTLSELIISIIFPNKHRPDFSCFFKMAGKGKCCSQRDILFLCSGLTQCPRVFAAMARINGHNPFFGRRYGQGHIYTFRFLRRNDRCLPDGVSSGASTIRKPGKRG